MSSELIGTDPELVSKEEEYVKYIDDHVRNVNTAFRNYFLPFINDDKLIVSDSISSEDFKEAIRNVSDQIEEHDASKYGSEEFFGYRRYFHPTSMEKIYDKENGLQKELFDEAWKHHYENNCHHTEFWVNKETKEINDMTLPAIIEMICDWIGMSIHFKNSTRDWYENKADKEKSQMTSNTKEIVEEILYNIISGPEL